MSSPKIAIIGAGPAGTTLARILYANGIENFKIFEREISPTYREQGSTLDLHPQTGQEALKRAKLWTEFQNHVRYGAENMIVKDYTGKLYTEVLDIDRGRPEIDRSNLRQILLDSIPSEKIRWDSNLRSVDLDGTLHFVHGTESGFDLVVGADGAWSKVRPLVTPVQPFYSGISGAEIRIRDIEHKHPNLFKITGSGSYFAFGEEEGKAILSQHCGDGCTRIWAVGWKPESWIKDCSTDWSNPQSARETLLEEFKNWHPEQKEIIANCDDDIIARVLYMLPPGLRWPTRPDAKITIIGDGAHLMTPFAGEGVNVAMHDAFVLAEAIQKNMTDVPKAIKEYEERMFAVAKIMTTKTWDSLLDRFETGGTQKFADRVNKSVETTKAKKQAEVSAE